MITLDTLTTPAAQQQFRDEGMLALGLSAVLLNGRWGDVTPPTGAYDPINLTIALPAPLRAPYFGVLEYANDGSDFADVTGQPLAGPTAIYRFHPQAFARLQQLAAWRYAIPEPRPVRPAGIALVPVANYQVQTRPVQVRPVPAAMVIRNMPGDISPKFYECDFPLDLPNVAASYTVSFHDGRGLIIDPLAVASMFADLFNTLPALMDRRFQTTTTQQGGTSAIAALAGAASIIHLVDPHGYSFSPGPSGATLSQADNAGVMGSIISSTLLDLPAGNQIVGSGPGPLMWGWSEDGWLRNVAIQPPALPAASANALPRQFFRLTVVDRDWHLLGNRTQGVVRGVAGDDGRIPASLLPVVRDRVELTYLPDGIDVIAAGNQIYNVPSNPGDTPMLFAVSPVIEAGVQAPPLGQPNRWPAWPATTGPATDFPRPVPDLSAGITAARSGDRDVVLTLPGGVLPDGAHVRIYPRQFVPIATIGEVPSFRRADGGATLVAGNDPVQVLLPNPLGLPDFQPFPSQATLTFDIVVTPRGGPRRLRASVSVPVTGTADVPPDSFMPAADLMGAMLAGAAWVMSVAPTPLFGMRRLTPPAGGSTPSNPIDLVRRLASETVPRQGPRLPMMARFETVLVNGFNDPAIAGNALRWAGVVSGGRWARETLSDRPTDGNPGHPAGPDIHASGVRVGGALAYDAARHAVKRAQPIVPLPGTVGSPSWMLMLASPNMTPPPTPAADLYTGVGAFLQTVAAISETPELSLPNIDLSSTTVTLDDVVQSVEDAFGLSDVITVPPSAADRVVDDVRREFYMARNGVRDALWSLNRALSEARELVYVESPQFARTALPEGPFGAHAIDMVEILRAALRTRPSLRLVVCTPQFTDIDPAFGGFARQHFAARVEAIAGLGIVQPPPNETDDQRGQRQAQELNIRSRILAYHPIGFPGRAAAVRTTSVIVDDVYALVGTSHFRRRGMTLDGAADIASFDAVIRNGYSVEVQQYRRRIMAETLGVPMPVAPLPGSADWLRLMTPKGAFATVRDMLSQGGMGRILPLWAGPTDNSVLAATNAMADPDGTNGASFVTSFAGFLAEDPDR